ncbi:MAG: hypothetical protein A2Z95_00905 [Gallionellales bacterium GWA2_60_18]|nr:MAG: hypothetical protein A2Z95_00905 [Gallionellales bacterium GWA2_60_18]
MSVAVYPEPYRIPAGVLALAVHGAFFALLLFGFTWQTQKPDTMSVELWQSIPDAAPEPQPKAQPKPEKVVPPEPPKAAPVPEIALPEKKKLEAKPLKPVPVETKQVVQKPVEPDPVVVAAEQAAARVREEQTAATGRVVDEFRAKIAASIRSRIVMPPDVADDARAEFLVTLLPGGWVLKAELRKSSGNAAYDNAVERAILKASPLPLPPDAALFNRFRNLELGFRPKE